MPKKPPTQEESAHMGLVAALGCCVCHNEGHGWSMAEIHHIEPYKGRNHNEVIGLCPHHHRTGNLGEAVHSGRKSWEANFGTERELLEQVREMLDDSLDSGR